MLDTVRRLIRSTPGVGPAAHSIYLHLMHGEGRRRVIRDGHLRGMVFVKFMHTFHDDYVDGSYESDLQDVLVDLLRADQVFYDVGANVGFMTLLAAKLVGTGGSVVAFEPGPLTSRQLLAQVRANQLGRVTVERSAVSDQVGTSRFAIDTYSVMAHLVAAEDGDRPGRGVTVPTTTLDHYTSDHPIPHVIKIDVEGAELAVIAGARRLLAEHRPILVVELHTEAISRRFHEEMAALGYGITLPDGGVAASGLYNRFVIARPRPLDPACP